MTLLTPTQTWGTDPDDEYTPPPDSAERKRASGKPEVLVQYCLSGIGYSQVQAVLSPPLSTVPDEDLPTGPKIAEKHLLMFSKMLKTTPDAMRQEFKQLARRKYQSAEEQASDLAKLLGVDEDLEACEYRDVAEANGNFADRQFRLVGNENLSQAYLDQKLWDREVIHHPEKTQEWLQMGADPNARNQSGRTILFRWAESCVPEQVAILLKAGADVNTGTDGQGRWERGVTALMVAAGRSFEQPDRVADTVKLLLDAGADVNARSETGRTALHEALVMTDGAEHQGKIGRHASEEILIQAAERSAQVVELLRAAGATE
ncbi:MAG: ankyrin repeat domain-containing protein [Janthinobacterium lividum]